MNTFEMFERWRLYQFNSTHSKEAGQDPQYPAVLKPPRSLYSTWLLNKYKRNNGKIENMNKIFYFDRAEYYHNANLNALKDNSVLKNYPSGLG